jgi:site-specific recombinase
MAKLVRLVPLKRLSLERIRSLFLTCVTPEQSAQWIDGIANEQLDRPPYKEILEAIAAEQKDMQEETIKYSNVQTRLRIESKLTLNQVELIELCKALSRMAPEYVFARTNTIEIQTKPKKILDAIRATINDYPKDEQPTVIN